MAQRGGAVYHLPALPLARPDRSAMPESLASHSLQWKQSPYLLSPLDNRVTEAALGQVCHPGAELCSGLLLTPRILGQSLLHPGPHSLLEALPNGKRTRAAEWVTLRPPGGLSLAPLLPDCSGG